VILCSKFNENPPIVLLSHPVYNDADRGGLGSQFRGPIEPRVVLREKSIFTAQLNDLLVAKHTLFLSLKACCAYVQYYEQ